MLRDPDRPPLRNAVADNDLLLRGLTAGPFEPRRVLPGQSPAQHLRELSRQAGAVEHARRGVTTVQRLSFVRSLGQQPLSSSRMVSSLHIHFGVSSAFTSVQASVQCNKQQRAKKCADQSC